MSYSQFVKHSLLKIEEKTDGERRAKLDGILRGAGSVGLSHAGISCEIATENYDLARKVARLTAKLYGVSPRGTSESHRLDGGRLYTVRVEPPKAQEILVDLGLMEAAEEIRLIHGFADRYPDAESAKSFLAGMFLGCGSASIPAPESISGYHLEFVVSAPDTAEELAHLLAEFDFIPKKVARKNSFVVYLKESEAICDFFAFLGASPAVLKLQEVMTERNLANTLNRQANCQAANIDKAVTASVRQLEAIQAIESTVGLDSLPKRLREVARLRRENPTDTLDELAEKLGGGVTKSGVNHRLRKLNQIANDLGGSQNDL